MALSPIQMTSEEISIPLEEQENESSFSPSKTYQFNFETGELENRFIDGKEAVRQAILKMLLTPRDRYAIYSSDYGSEIESLMEEQVSFEYMETEIVRLISECVEWDDRVESVDNFKITRQGDSLLVGFDVFLLEGDTWYEEVQF